MTTAGCSVDGPAAALAHERLLRRPAQEKMIEALRRGMGKNSEAARAISVSLSSVKRYAKMADQGRPLAPKKGPGVPYRRRARTPSGFRRPTSRSARPRDALGKARTTPGEGLRDQGERLDALSAVEADGVHTKKGLWAPANATSGRGRPGACRSQRPWRRTAWCSRRMRWGPTLRWHPCMLGRGAFGAL